MHLSLRLPVAVAAALAVTEAAVLLLRPRSAPAEPAPVAARAYFSEAELRRARDFRRGQRRLALASAVLDTALLAGLVRQPPAGLARCHPALAAAALTAGTTAAGLPLEALARRRSRAVGLVTQSWGGWAEDLLKAQSISAPLSAGAGTLLVAGMQRHGERWWVGGAAGLVAGGVLALLAGPVLLDPIFNRFEPADPELRARVSRLAEAAGVRVDRVLVVDASRRTTASNAYVTGLGATRRVVLFDTLLRDFSAAEVDFVVAHELAHVRHRDVSRGLLLVAVAAPAATYAIAQLADALGAEPDARALAATALAAGLLAPALGVVTNTFSRAIERRADRFAMALVGDARTQIAFQRSIAVRNVAEPEPPAWVQLLRGSHPTTLERIAMAEEVLASAS